MAKTDRQILVNLRNLIVTPEGQQLIDYLSDYITEIACRNKDANEIKGMCELLQQIKVIPSKLENYKEN